MEPMEIHGEQIDPGSFVFTSLGSSNRDPQIFGDDADSLDLGRATAGRHLSFGSGLHHCLGASLGGWVAADLATKNTSRISRIVLVSPVGIKVGPRDKLDIPDIFFTPQAELDAMTMANPEKGRFTAEGKSDEELRILARNKETMALVAWEPYMHNPKLKHRLHNIDRPTLMLHGSHDRLVNAEYCEAYAKLIPGCALETMANAGHSPQNEAPEAFVERVTRFALN